MKNPNAPASTNPAIPPTTAPAIAGVLVFLPLSPPPPAPFGVVGDIAGEVTVDVDEYALLVRVAVELTEYELDELVVVLGTWELSGKSTPKCERCFCVKYVQVLLTACQFCNGNIEAIFGITWRHVRPVRNDCVCRNRSWVRAFSGSHGLWAVRLPSCPGDECAVLAGTASRHQIIDNSRADT